MIWFVIILALVTGLVVGIITRSLRKALIVCLVVLGAGVILSLLILFSGILGG